MAITPTNLQLQLITENSNEVSKDNCLYPTPASK